MNYNALEEQLGKLQYVMSESLLEEMVNEAIDQSTIRLISMKWLILGIASCIALLFVSIYWQTGSIDYNSILGLESITTDDLNNYILYL